MEASKDVIERVYQAIELAKTTGKLKKGTNEVTKAIERGQAKLVAVASDVTPAEVVMHIPLLCKERKTTCYKVGTKEELGAAAGLNIGTSAVAIVAEGEAKNLLKELIH